MARSAILLAISFALACANHPSGTDGATTVWNSGRGYTLVNLHPNDEQSLLSAANFQQPGLIPVCSELEYLDLRLKGFTFRVVATDREYLYRNHKTAAEPFLDHLNRFFGPICPSGEIEFLSEIDRQGIREGRAFVGMTRRGVILAMGHPPRHVNTDPNAPAFYYWKSRLKRVVILFGPDGLVSGIKG
jgi:hypothetical protein